jgi:hypothetical protein
MTAAPDDRRWLSQSRQEVTKNIWRIDDSLADESLKLYMFVIKKFDLPTFSRYCQRNHQSLVACDQQRIFYVAMIEFTAKADTLRKCCHGLLSLFSSVHGADRRGSYAGPASEAAKACQVGTVDGVVRSVNLKEPG